MHVILNLMNKIQMVDLQKQYQRLKEDIDSAIAEVLNTSAFINGPAVKKFQANLEKYLGGSHVIPCANGTDALQIAMMALDLQPGDEVITTSFTYVATAEVIALLKLTPVLVEVNESTFTMDPKALEMAITSKTKAIVPVHLYGQCADMESILAIAQKHNLYVIEDTAQAIGADYTFSDGTVKKAGTMGTIGATSFFPSKNLGCYGDGGALFTSNEALATKIRMIANHGQSVQYVHDVIGVNSRLDSLQAAILEVKLAHLDDFNKRRNAVASTYDQAFSKHPKLIIPGRNLKSTHVFHQYTLRLIGVDRDALRKHMSDHNIPTMVYYPIALHHQKAFQGSAYDISSLQLTELLCTQVISLPIHTEMEAEQQAFIIDTLLNYLNK